MVSTDLSVREGLGCLGFDLFSVESLSSNFPIEMGDGDIFLML